MSTHNKLLSILVAVLLGSGLLCSCSVKNDNRADLIASRLDEKAGEIISNKRLPSLQVTVIYRNKVACSKSYGQHASLDTVYMNGSVQKVLDASAVLQLHERELIDIDADISDYIPFKIRHPNYPDTPITIRMLLIQRSGLDALDHQFSWDTECLFSEYRQAKNLEIAKMSLEEFLVASFTPEGSNFNPDVWINKPGDKYHYSVSVYPLLRYMIEKVTGMSYPDYMSENIFKPLGMLNTGFRSNELGGQHLIPYTRIEGENIELPIWDGNGYLMRTTTEDMAKFMLAHMNDGRYNQFQLLQPETIQLMQTKTSSGRNIFNLSSELTDPGYGVGLIHYPDGWFGHGGSTIGYQSLWQFNKSKQNGFIIFTNINGILGNDDDFLSVWENVADIRNLLLSLN